MKSKLKYVEVRKMKRFMSEPEILKIVGITAVTVDLLGIGLTIIVAKKMLQRKIIKESENVLGDYIQYTLKEKNNEK